MVFFQRTSWFAGALNLEHGLNQWISKSSPQTSNISFPWKRTGMQTLRPHQTCWIRHSRVRLGMGASNLCFSKASRLFWHMLKFENYWLPYVGGNNLCVWNSYSLKQGEKGNLINKGWTHCQNLKDHFSITPSAPQPKSFSPGCHRTYCSSPLLQGRHLTHWLKKYLLNESICS